MEQQNAAPKKVLRYEDKVIKKIAGIATESVPGILTVSSGLTGLAGRLRPGEDWTRGITAEIGRRQVALDIDVVTEFGYNVPQLFDAVTMAVAKAMTDMTGLEVVELNLHVTDVLSPGEFSQMEQKQHSGGEQSYQSYLPPDGRAQAAAAPVQ